MTIVENRNSARRPRGRPRAFDRNVALGAATTTFWRLGYEGASITDLTTAMGITPQSLYAAFTSKADLYREALAWYQANVGAFTAQVLRDDPNIVTAFERVLVESARQFSLPDRPHGCMISIATLTCASENAAIAQHVARLRRDTLALFRDRIEQGIASGALRPDTDADVLSRYLGAIIQGMSVQAKDGASEDELLGIARIASVELARHGVVQTKVTL